MSVRHFALSDPVMVSDLLTYCAKELGADFTGYAMTGHHVKDNDGNTILELFDADNRVLYHVDPYAGYLSTIGKRVNSLRS